MDLRLLEHFHIENTAIHMLDKAQEAPITSLQPIELTQELAGILVALTTKTAQSNDAQKGRFVEGSRVDTILNSIRIDPTMLLPHSQGVAAILFDIIKGYADINSGAMVTMLAQYGEERLLIIMKLDYEKHFTHALDVLDYPLIDSADKVLPEKRQKLTALAIMPLEPNSEILVYERPPVEGPRWFLERFLGATRVLDKREQTALFRRKVEGFIRVRLKGEFAMAKDARDHLNNELLGSAFIKVDEFAEALFSGDQLQAFREMMSRSALAGHPTIEVDRFWVDTKLKKRTFKLDNGFMLRADNELFDDPARIELRYNADGGVDYIIKNVRNVLEA